MTVTADLADTPLASDADLLDALGALLGTARREQMWWLFLDADDCLLGPLMPTDGWPADPFKMVVTPDLGERSIAEVLAHRIAVILGVVGAARLVLVWERPRVRSASTAADRWAAAMAAALQGEQVELRAQALLARDGVRLLDLGGSSSG